jgi:DNA-binding transcriptional LysR family regulator
VRQGSLTGAAEVLGISRSAASKQLAALEKKVGARLLTRTTRKLVLTDIGRQVLRETRKVEQALQAIEQYSEDNQSELSGGLKVSCSSAQGRIHLVPLITKFLARYPGISVNLQLEDRFIDMIAENVDVSIRIGYLPDSSLIARRIGDLSWVLCASPEYLRTAPPLVKPDDLLNHRCLFYRNAKSVMNTWTFKDSDNDHSVVVDGPLSINDASALVSAAVDHAGVLLIDRSMLGDTLDTGKLVPLLEDYEALGGLPMYVVYPEKEFMLAKTRALVEFLLAELPELI